MLAKSPEPIEQQYDTLLRHAANVRALGAAVLPDILQTPAYTRALMARQDPGQIAARAARNAARWLDLERRGVGRQFLLPRQLLDPVHFPPDMSGAERAEQVRSVAAKAGSGLVNMLILPDTSLAGSNVTEVTGLSGGTRAVVVETVKTGQPSTWEIITPEDDAFSACVAQLDQAAQGAVPEQESMVQLHRLLRQVTQDA